MKCGGAVFILFIIWGCMVLLIPWPAAQKDDLPLLFHTVILSVLSPRMLNHLFHMSRAFWFFPSFAIVLCLRDSK